MKTKHLISALLMSSLSTVIFAAPFFQAGNIFDGQRWRISSNSNENLASYYADGKQGDIKFSCKLEGDEIDQKPVLALLVPGKNFSTATKNNQAQILVKGENGPFIWTLTDEKQNNGNIKVFYSSGANVFIQCGGKKLQAV